MGAVADFFDDPWGTITDGVERGLGYIEDVFDADEWAHDPLGQLVTIVGSPASREVYEGLKEGAEDLAHNLGLGGKDTGDSVGAAVAAAKSPAADSLAETGGDDKDEGGTVVPEIETKGNVGGEGSGNNGAGGNRASALVSSGLVSQGAGTFGFTEPDDASKKTVQKLGA